jgi:hypothetical protein
MHRSSHDWQEHRVAYFSRLWPVALWACLMAFTVLLAARNWRGFQIGVYQDDAEYAVLARSLVHSPAYGLINAPGEPAASRYPFGYPLALAPFAALFPNSLDALRGPSLIASLLNVSILFWGWKLLNPSGSRFWAAAVAVVYALSPLVLGAATMVMSEAVFSALALLAFLLARRSRGSGLLNVCLTVALGALLTLVVCTRTVGLLVPIALLASGVLAGASDRVRLLPAAGQVLG